MRALDIACPRCFVLPGEDCVQVGSGRPAFRVHMARAEQAKRMSTYEPKTFAEMLTSDPVTGPLVEAGIIDVDRITETTRRVEGEADVTFAEVPLSRPPEIPVPPGFCCSSHPGGAGLCDRHQAALSRVRREPGLIKVVPPSGTEHNDYPMPFRPEFGTRRPNPMEVECCGRSADDPRRHGIGLCWGPRWIGRLRGKR